MLAACFGLFVGILLGLTGGSGGILALPILMLALGYNFEEAKPIALFSIALSASWAALEGIKKGIVRYRAAIFMAMIGVAFAPFGLWLANYIAVEIVLSLFTLLLIYTSIQMWNKSKQQIVEHDRSITPCQINQKTGRLAWTSTCFQHLTLLGGSSGLLSGLLGIGGGMIIVPGMKSMSNVQLHSIVATSLTVVALVSLSTLCLISYQGLNLHPHSYPFILFTLIGLVLGRQLISYIPAKHLQRLCAILLMLSAGLMATHFI